MRLLLKLLLFFFTQSVFSQYLASTNYTTADGLPNNAVRSLFIDRSNVLWIGTENGISRLQNGIFQTIDETDGLSHNSCWDIAQDANGTMWFASYGGGISKYDGRKFTIFTKKNGLPANKTRKIFPFRDKVYVGTEQGISIIDINSNKVITPNVPKTKEDFICMDFFIFEGEVYFISIFDGLFKIDEKGEKPIVVPVFKGKNFYSQFLNANTIYFGNEGFVQQTNLPKLLKGKADFTTFGTSIIWDFAQTRDGKIYAAADGVYNPDGGVYEIMNNQMINVSEQLGIDSKIILNVVYDAQRNVLYAGSNDKGIYEIRLGSMIKSFPFLNRSCIDFELVGNEKFVLHNEGISILNASGALKKEVFRSDFKKFESDYIKQHPGVFKTDYRESRDFELNFKIPAEGIVFYEMVKNSSTIWVASNIGIFELNTQGKIISYIPKHSLKIGFTSDGKFIETITFAGVYVYDDVYSLKGTHYSKFEDNTPQFIVKILNHKDKTYLISVFNGLYVHQKSKFRSYLSESIWKEKKFKHITVNAKDQLVLAAEFGDVFIVEDDKQFKIKKKISKDEIAGKTINFLESYKDYLLIGTESGITIYHNGNIRLIDKEQGLKNCNFKSSKIFKDELWLGTEKGYYVLNLNQLLSDQKTAQSMAIEKILINNQPISKANYNWFEYSGKELICDYKHNSFAVDFVPKGHLFPNKLKFRYRLNSSNRWSPYSDKPSVFLSYLPHGNYNLEIEVFDQNAGKVTVFQLLKIVVQSPFWLRWWFIAGLVLIVILIVVYGVIRYKNKAKEKALIEKRIAETKLDALLSQMNPHFTFNAMNTVQDFIISNDVDNSLLFISELARLMRLTLDNSSKKTIPLDEEISFLKTYIKLENMRFGNRVTVNIVQDKAIDAPFIEVPTMLLQPFVENVFVHAFNDEHPNPKLDITFRMKARQLLECTISDNGKGKASFQKVKLHKSKALLLAAERLQLLQPEIENPISTDFTEQNGTQIRILLKV
ncbi:histidine kinase [Flavobacterium enshiense]|uniref:sensor histidine kinase n=1 Tax=Flavobacterium enshiense TaxID=1341165 RepID=UPI00345D0219